MRLTKGGGEQGGESDVGERRIKVGCVPFLSEIMHTLTFLSLLARMSTLG